MFLSEETELDKLKKEIKKLNQDKNEIVETVMKLHEMIKTLEQRNDDLIEISKGIIRNFEKKHTQQHSDLEVEKKEEVTKTQ